MARMASAPAAGLCAGHGERGEDEAGLGDRRVGEAGARCWSGAGR